MRFARAAARSVVSFARAVQGPYYVVQAMGVRAPERLYIAPQDIRTADPTVADEIYAGYFSFDGKVVETNGRSPFAITPPSPGWRRSLAGFSWLRHLRAADRALARANARALVDEYLRTRADFIDDPALEPRVVARRTLSWLAQSPILLEGADQEFYERFMRALARNIRFLLRAMASERRASDRLLCAVALAAYGVCADAGRKYEMRATGLLDAELSRQILPDGGHIGRNPETPVELLLDLLPLRQAYAARGRRPPERLLASIGAMISFLRVLKHGDGALALFNGMGYAPPDRLATILAHADASGAPMLDAPHSGYRRLQAGEAIVIVDAGAPPPPLFSFAAHAGCLSFEFSIGVERIVVNCGAPPAGAEALRRVARSTAAHSTLVVEDRSTCRIEARPGRSRPGERIVAGPALVKAARRSTASSHDLELAHDGYVREFGLVHERTLALAHDGSQLLGDDRLVALRHGARAENFVLRFHLHPNVRVMGANDRKVLLSSGGVDLVFEANAAVAVEESVFFAGAAAARKSAQIVVYGRGVKDAHLRWSFSRVEEG
ncbi:heparinase II/III family protein [Methylosinus sp. H3A]|uniref:heparinase II/III family protein n=1 Tax=Methylosinus sp. H3A TaxID=2785786 RepID=UPI0018C31243|nr:heparinase II/III family protein [Methylosinus sp. H3A]MBG0811103.1 heparinase II/III family protein [Methylosinus sp. H3A]